MLEVKENNELHLIKDRLRMTDWNFSERRSGHAIEAIHPYPAKFIPEIPKALLSALPIAKGMAVFDPFCGSGTTLAVAQEMGLPSIGIDLNPIACLIARVKTGPVPVEISRVAEEIVNDAQGNLEPELWDIPNVDHWFKQDIQKAIAAIVQEINKIQDSASYNLLRLALSSIIVRVSNQESDTRYAAIHKLVTESDVFNYFLAACQKISNALLTRDWPLEPQPRVIEADTLEIDSSVIGMPVGIVITSPPYPNAYEYWLYHKYRMWWLGFDPIAVKSQEIGARAHFFKRDHHTEENFVCQMRRTFALINSVLVDCGFACFVIGRSKIHGRIIDNAEIIKNVAEEHGLRVITSIERVISANRKSFNLSHAKIKTETIIVFQKK